MGLDAWLLDDAIVVDDNGDVVLCNQCPCGSGSGSGPPPACCPDTTPQPLYAYVGYFAERSPPPAFLDIPPYGCDALAKCANWEVDSDGVDDVYYGHVSFPFYFNIQSSPIFESFLGCWPLRLRYTCITTENSDNQPETENTLLMAIDYHNTGDFTTSETVILAADQTNGDGDCHAPLLGCVAIIPDDEGWGAWVFLQETDPLDGIIAPDSTNVPIVVHFHITLTNSGVPIPYSCDLTFAPNPTFVQSAVCFSWIGCFTDCKGNAEWVQLFFDGLGNWNLALFADANDGFLADNSHIMYQSTAFPTMGNGDIFGSVWKVCNDDGTNPPWSLVT